MPVSETGAARFNELLARAYVLGDHGGIKDDGTTVQTWFKGVNPSLDTVSAHVLREGDPLKGARDVIAVAKSFANIG